MLERQQDISGDDLLSVWKARIDEVATRLMVEGAGSGVVEDLQAIGADLKQHNAAASLNILNELVARLQADEEAGAAHLLKKGLAELQESLPSMQQEEEEAPAKAAPVSLAEDPELVADFLVEAREHLSQIEGQMLVLERDPGSLDTIHAVFRAFHTIKGLAGFLDFSKVQGLAHEVETLLDLARNQKLSIDSTIVDIVLESGDALQSDLTAIEDTLNKGVPLVMVDDRALISKIRAITSPGSAASAPVAQPSAEASAEPEPEAKPQKAAKSASRNTKPKKQKTVEPAAVQEEVAPAPEPVAKAAPIAAPAPEVEPKPTPAEPVPASAPRPAVSVAAEPAPKPAPVAAAPKPAAREEAQRPAAGEQTPAREERRSADASSVRVETSKLDHLMDMVGEIVIAQSLIRHNSLLASVTDSRLLGDLSQLARVTVEVQRATMSMRMVPMSQLFQRIERVIRDLSRKAGKLVVLETSGNDTEIDKTVAEELSDPLLHMVRNSVDHGIEQQAERVTAGKSPEARIKLSAYHQGGQVVIEISDDGRGLNPEKIRAKAIDRGLISPEEQLSETEIHQLIFEPGFSTAEKLTDVSGRGVGMDVVRRNVEKLRGRIETQSTVGQGTTFLLKLPLTLAIIDGLVIEVGTERYIIPLAGVREIFRPQPDALFTVEGKDEMLLVRGKLIPVVRLHERFRIEARAKQPSEGLIVVLESQDRNFCLLVDDLLGKQEVVIKSLGEAFKDIPGLSGCAVLGDGCVGLILDVDGICRGKR